MGEKDKDKEFVRVLNLLTTATPEALPPNIAKPVFQMRKVIREKNIVAVGIGEKITGNKGTGVLAIRFYVVRKLNLRKLKASEAVPPTVHAQVTGDKPAIPTDVIVLGKLRLDAKAKVIRPGDSIGHIKISAGTMGALIWQKKTLAALSNSHVLANSGKAKKGDAILAPGSADGGKVPQDVVAHLARFKKFVTGGSFVNRVDCASAIPVPARLHQFKSMIPGVGVPKGTIKATRGMKIVKVGRTTGKTVGVVHDIHFRFAIPYEGVGKVGFIDQVLCSRYSDSGDSGALVVDRKTKRAAGLHFASAPQGSVFCPIDAVLQALGGATLVTTSVP